MNSISLCLIVKNEEALLSRCLESARVFADEIIVVDTGSIDSTKKIARRFTKRIFDFPWVNDFSAARNFSFGKASKDYIMWLDADDVVPPETAKAILELKHGGLENLDMVTMKYDLGGGFFSTRERIFRRAKNYKWSDPVHEYIAIQDKVKNLDAAIWHRPKERPVRSDRNLKIYQAMLERGPLSPRGKYYYARELRDHGKAPEAAEYFQAFLDEGLGWIEDNIEACAALASCFSQMGQDQKRLDALLKSFQFDGPRPNICCALGYLYKERNEIERAAMWFQTALVPPVRPEMGFVSADYRDFIPAIELAVCFDILGDIKRANEFNELAGRARPDSPQYLSNKKYFQARLGW
jgi:glycosyltransferase involved in cell wall biosynthesis